MMLLADLGNTRVKWAWLQADGIGPQRAAAHAGWHADDWRREVFAGARPQRVVACTVAGRPQVEGLEKAAREEAGVTVEWVVPTRYAAGVTNGYVDPAQLGADRWLAVIGAYHDRAVDCCVAGVGTAMTIDAVTSEGRHLGGLIVPGPDLMIAALHAETSDLAGRTAQSGARAKAAYAADTRNAIENGCELALAALVERQCREFELMTGRVPRLLFTGGAAARIREWVTPTSEVLPDLVLRGLAVVATQPTP